MILQEGGRIAANRSLQVSPTEPAPHMLMSNLEPRHTYFIQVDTNALYVGHDVTNGLVVCNVAFALSTFNISYNIILQLIRVIGVKELTFDLNWCMAKL